MEKLYRSKYGAYPFLSDAPEDYRCDFELLTDEIASLTGLLQSMVSDEQIREELGFVCGIIYHINPSLRTHISVTQDELMKLEGILRRIREELGDSVKGFVLPMGCQSAALSHVLRVKCKAVVRLLYKHNHQGHKVDDLLFDFTNLLSGYFFHVALKLNLLEGIKEITYTSRNYK